MKNIRRLQFEKVRELYRSLLRYRDEKPDQYTIEKLSNEVLYSTVRTPMSGKYRMGRHSLVDIGSLNVELGLVKADVETIYDYIDLLQKRLRTMKYVADVWKRMASNKIKQTMVELAQMTAPAFISGFTHELDPNEIMDQNNTTLVIDSDKSITLPMVVNKARRYKHRSTDISIKPIGDDLQASIMGNATTVFNADENGSLTLTLSGQRVDEAGFRIELNTDMGAVNYLYLQMSNVRNGVKIMIDVSSDRSKYTNIYDSVVTRDRIDVPMDEMDIKKVVIVITMDAPSVVLMNEVRYEFKLDKVLMLSDKRKLTGRFQTKEIPVEDTMSYLSLAVEDEAIGKATIKYYMATEKDSNGNPVGFFYLDPKKEGSLVNLKSSLVRVGIGPQDLNDPRWTLPSLKDYGSRLFNILDAFGIGTFEETEDFKIVDGRLVMKSGELIPETFRMWCGVNDYVRKERAVIIERNVDWIAVQPEDLPEILWVKRIPLRLRVNDLIDDRLITHAGGGRFNQIVIPYTVLNYEELRVTRDDGREINALISGITYGVGTTTVTFVCAPGATLLDPAYKYHVTYAVALKEYAEANSMEITLDLDSVNITAGETDLIQDVDYIVYRNDLEIELFKHGKYRSHYNVDYTDSLAPQNNCEPIVMKYKFRGDTGKTMSYYETFVYADVPMNIIVLPFTTSEIAAGNFHAINGERADTLSSVTLKQGWNKIESTQPFPSRNEYDVNTATGLQSRAGIVIPDDVSQMTPFEDSMRQVAPFTLATMDLTEGSKCFSFADGRLLINYQPTFLEKTFLDDPLSAGVVGTKFLNKRAIYTITYENAGWTPSPESFTFEFGYTSSGAKRAYVRIDIECQDTKSVGRVLRLGLNKYKEV